VANVRRSVHLVAREIIEHIDVALGTAQEPETKLTHESWSNAASNNAGPRGKPIAELLRSDVLNQ
jgi:hypothetical protein